MLEETNTSLTALDRQLADIIFQVKEIQSYLTTNRPAVVPSRVYQAAAALTDSMPAFRKQVSDLQGDWRSLRALAQIGQVVNSSLDLNVVLQIVMDTIIKLTGAERGFLMLRTSGGELETCLARNWEQESLDQNEVAVSRTIINRVVGDSQPILTTNAQEDPRFGSQQSVVAYNLRSILCVPIKSRTQLIGVIYADNRVRSGLFTVRELELLMAFSNQAAVAIENARLFASVRKTLAEVTELKNLMDNVFSSIASGVLTTDIEERVVMCNQAAQMILGKSSHEMIGKPLVDLLSLHQNGFTEYVHRVIRENQSITGVEVNPNLPGKGEIDLRLSLSPLRDAKQLTQGVAIVFEDLTEKKKLEAQRRLFERMVSPAVIHQLDPDSLQLGGRRNQITILFADIRNFTSFSEKISPEELFFVLNRYLATAADKVLDEEGTIDKFLGDAVMAWFNAPILQPDHVLRAVRSALAIQKASLLLQREFKPAYWLEFGIGIHTGEALLGLIGTEKRLEYTAIGNSVNIARRLQENALPGQILISQETFQMVEDRIIARAAEPIIAKGKRDPLAVYEVLGLR